MISYNKLYFCAALQTQNAAQGALQIKNRLFYPQLKYKSIYKVEGLKCSLRVLVHNIIKIVSQTCIKMLQFRKQC